MSHISVDLKVIEVHAPMVARTLEEPVALTLGGLNLLWHRCWSTKTTTITRIGLAGIFGMDKLDLRIEAMVDAGFLEPASAGFQVCGAVKYLRIREGNSKGGHASKGNLRRGQAQPGEEPESEPEPSREGAGEEPKNRPGSKPALTPSTEHRTPNTREEEAPPPPQVAAQEPRVLQFDVVAPAGDPEVWTKEDFWRWAESTRRKAGCPPEKWPSPMALARWWTEARAAADVAVLKEAFLSFGDDPHWQRQRPPLPWAGFAVQWNQFLPMGGGDRVA